jgi:hypothetical protein
MLFTTLQNYLLNIKSLFVRTIIKIMQWFAQFLFMIISYNGFVCKVKNRRRVFMI